MNAQLAAVVLAASLMQAPAVSHAQDDDMGPMGQHEEMGHKFNWVALGYGTFGLYGHDIVVTPEGGKYVVMNRGERDMAYDSLTDAKARGEELASMKKPSMKEKTMKGKPMMEKKTMLKKEMSE